MNTITSSIGDEVDAALAEDASRRQALVEERQQRMEAESRRFSRIGRILRHVGIAVLVASAVTFLLQRWDGMEHVTRYLSFLGFTAMLCAGGLLTGLKIKEDKGARTLLGAVALLAPIHFAQLGAILFSRFGGEQVASSYPYYLHWDVPSLGAALATVVGGLMALLPMLYAACAVLVRQRAKSVFSATALVGVALLIPSREPHIMGALLAFVAVAALVSGSKLRRFPEMRTVEGAVARSVPYLAVAVLAGRQAMLYQMPHFLMGVLQASITVGLLSMAGRLKERTRLSPLFEIIALPSALVSWILISSDLDVVFTVPAVWSVPLFGMLLVGILSVMERYVTYTAQGYRLTTALVFTVVGCIEALVFSQYGVVPSMFALVLGIGGVAWACVNERRLMLGGSMLVVFVSLGTAVYRAFGTVTISPWFALGAIGLFTIIGGSYLERNFARVSAVVTTSYGRVRQWK
jgi:hypothetical protein